MLFQIYALIDPREPDVIRYVGQTQKTLDQRLKEHLRLCVLKAHTHKNHWLLKVIADGRVPLIRCIETCETREQANVAERAWINFGREQAWPLTNQTDGGYGGAPTEEVRQRLAELSRLHWHNNPVQTPEVRKRRIEGQLKAFSTPEYKAKRSAISKRAWQKPEYRQRISACRKGNQHNKGRKYPNRAKPIPHKRQPPTEETKEKMRQAMARYYSSPENREKVRQRTLQQYAAKQEQR